MKIIKAQFKDQGGIYTMTWSYNPELWDAKDIIQNECKKNRSTFLKFIIDEKSNQKS